MKRLLVLPILPLFPSSSRSLAKGTVIARVNGTLHDLDRPLEGDASLELLDFDSRDGQAVSTPVHLDAWGEKGFIETQEHERHLKELVK